jgi:hypothetical protein
VKARKEDWFIVKIISELTNQRQTGVVRQSLEEQKGLLDWNYVIRKMHAEGVAFLFFYYLAQFHLQDLLPAAAVDWLSGQYYANLKRNMMAAAALRPVFEKFSEQQLPFIVLKGIVLAEQFYPGFAARGMSDADILIRKTDLHRVDAFLSALGYAARDSSVARALDNPVGYLASLDYRKHDGSLPNLHIHWHPVNTSTPAYMFAGRVDLDRLWEMAISTTVAGTKARILSPEHKVIYLC